MIYRYCFKYMKELNLQEILENTSDLKEKKVGYVAVVWRPNVGKSSFLNELIGEKISITSDVPQTTRNKILAIYNDDISQIIFFDTPWIHESNKMFNEEINNQAISSLSDAELILYFIDSTRPSGSEEAYIQDIVTRSGAPTLRVYTKADISSTSMDLSDKHTFSISSVTREGFSELLAHIQDRLPIGPILFPEEYYTKQTMFFRVSEVIREKVFFHTKQELPHSIYIAVEEIDESDPKLLRIVAYIYTETESQKYIVIGKSGKLITKIGTEARQELEKIFDTKVFLALRAKTKKWWRKDEKFLKNMFQ